MSKLQAAMIFCDKLPWRSRHRSASRPGGTAGICVLPMAPTQSCLKCRTFDNHIQLKLTFLKWKAFWPKEHTYKKPGMIFVRMLQNQLLHLSIVWWCNQFVSQSQDCTKDVKEVSIYSFSRVLPMRLCLSHYRALCDDPQKDHKLLVHVRTTCCIVCKQPSLYH